MNKPLIQLGARIVGLALLVAIVFDVNDENGHAAVAVYRKNGKTLYFAPGSPEYEALRLWTSWSVPGWLVLPNAAFQVTFIRDVDLNFQGGIALSLDNGPLVFHRHGTLEAEAIKAFVQSHTTWVTARIMEVLG